MDTNMAEMDLFSELDKGDREKVSYFLKLLLNQSKYKRLRREVASRRSEIRKGHVLSHDEVWGQVDV